MIFEQINKGGIYFEPNHPIHTREYYLYIVSLYKELLQNNDINIKFLIGDYHINDNDIFKIDIQCEHTLVIDGGRSVNEKIFGTIKHTNGEYLIRIDKYDYFNSLNQVIEYSLPNINNIKTNKQFNTYLSKNIYIPPLIYNKTDFNHYNRTDIIGLFDINGNERRTKIVKNITNTNFKLINNIFDKDSLKQVYNNSKILVNIHQTDHHHTFEELRILPALMNGVLIISENVPLKDKIPYGEFIIWTEYDNLNNKINDVFENYEYYYNQIFNNKLNDIITEMFNKTKLKYEGCITNSWLS